MKIKTRENSSKFAQRAKYAQNVFRLRIHRHIPNDFSRL